MPIVKRRLATQVGQFQLPRVSRFKSMDDAQRWAQNLLRVLEEHFTVLTGVQDNGTTQPIRALIDFVGATVTDDLANDRTQVAFGGGGGAAPINATYIVVSLSGSLTAERVLTAGAGLTSTDGGANGNFTLDVGGSSSVAVAADSISVANSGVAAATYGSAANVGQFAVGLDGRITSASNVAISLAPSFADALMLMGG